MDQELPVWLQSEGENGPTHIHGPEPQHWLPTGLLAELYTLYSYDCTSTHHSNTIVKYADGITVVGLISGGDETAYREETVWCRENDLLLNTSKTK